MIANDPESIYELSRRMFEAMEVEDVDEILKKPTAPEPQRIDDQIEEIRLFLMPENERPFFDVFEDQNHELHVAIIDDFVSDPANEKFRTSMTKEQMAALMEHRQKHMAYLYEQEQGELDGEREALAMAALGGDAVGINGVGGEVAGEAALADLLLGQGGEIQGATGRDEFAGESENTGGLASELLQAPLSTVQ